MRWRRWTHNINEHSGDDDYLAQFIERSCFNLLLCKAVRQFQNFVKRAVYLKR